MTNCYIDTFLLFFIFILGFMISINHIKEKYNYETKNVNLENFISVI